MVTQEACSSRAGGRAKAAGGTEGEAPFNQLCESKERNLWGAGVLFLHSERWQAHSSLLVCRRKSLSQGLTKLGWILSRSMSFMVALHDCARYSLLLPPLQEQRAQVVATLRREHIQERCGGCKHVSCARDAIILKSFQNVFSSRGQWRSRFPNETWMLQWF